MRRQPAARRERAAHRWPGLALVAALILGCAGTSPRPAAPGSGAGPARDLLARAVRETFAGDPAALHTFAWGDTGTMSLAEATYPLVLKTVRSFPRWMWSEQHLPHGINVMAFGGDSGWVRTPREVRPMRGQEIEAMGKDRALDLLQILLDAKSLDPRLAPDTVLATGPAHRLALDRFGITGLKLSLDAASGRIVRIDYQEPKPVGPGTNRISWEFQDYRLVGSLVYWPHLRVKSFDGTKYLEFRTQTAEVNREVPPALFAIPKE